MSQRLLDASPYLAALALAAVLYAIAGTITYDARAGQIGPDFWPKAAIGLMAAASLVEVARILVFGGRGGTARGIEEALEGPDAGEAEAPRRPLLLLAGMGLTLAYAVLVGVLGFLLATFLYLVVFMYVGCYRSHLTIWLSAAVGMAVFALIFLKLVYVSLPRGIAPFDAVTDFVTALIGAR